MAAVRIVYAVIRALSLVLISGALLAAAGLAYARISGHAIYSVQSGSMSPAIERGDAVIVGKSSADLGVGDIVSFTTPEYPGVIVTHRIMQIDKAAGRLITKGDVAGRADKPVPTGQVIGTTDRIVPYLGYGLDFLRRPAGLVVVLYLPAFVLASGELKRLARQYERRYYRLHTYFSR